MASSPSPRKLSAHDVNTLDDTELDQYLEEAEGAVFFDGTGVIRPIRAKLSCSRDQPLQVLGPTARRTWRHSCEEKVSEVVQRAGLLPTRGLPALSDAFWLYRKVFSPSPIGLATGSMQNHFSQSTLLSPRSHPAGNSALEYEADFMRKRSAA